MREPVVRAMRGPCQWIQKENMIYADLREERSIPYSPGCSLYSRRSWCRRALEEGRLSIVGQWHAPDEGDEDEDGNGAGWGPDKSVDTLDSKVLGHKVKVRGLATGAHGPYNDRFTASHVSKCTRDTKL
jgi:hypothetical protein